MNTPTLVRARSRLSDVRVWVLAALACSALLRLAGAGGESRLWFLDPLLLIGFLAAVRSDERRWKEDAPLSRGRAALAFVGLSWLAAMLYELTLSAGSGGTFGGLHPQTLPSFALAQGFYVPFAVFGLALVRRYDYTFRQLFFAAGAVSLFEMFSTGVGPSLLASPFVVLLPLAVAYYFAVYAMFVCWPVALFGIDRFRDKSPRAVTLRRKAAAMLLSGAGSWLVFGAWGALLAHLSPRFVIP